MARELVTRHRFAVALGAALLGVMAASPALAQGRAGARQHLTRADELKKQGKVAEACGELDEAQRLEPKLPTLLELAECTESIGKLNEAQAQWMLARDQAKRDEKPQSRARAEARLAAVQKRVPHVTLQLAVASVGAQVLLDDVALEPASLSSALPVNPGDHVVVVKAAGHDDARYALKLTEGDNQTLPIALGPTAGTQPALAAATPTPSTPALVPALPKMRADAPAPAATPVTGWWTGPHMAGVLCGAVGLAAIGGGSALVASAHADGHVDRTASLGGVSIATGGVLLVSGLVLLVSAPRDDANQHARSLTPTLVVARNATVLGATGEF